MVIKTYPITTTYSIARLLFLRIPLSCCSRIQHMSTCRRARSRPAANPPRLPQSLLAGLRLATKLRILRTSVPRTQQTCMQNPQDPQDVQYLCIMFPKVMIQCTIPSFSAMLQTESILNDSFRYITCSQRRTHPYVHNSTANC